MKHLFRIIRVGNCVEEHGCIFVQKTYFHCCQRDVVCPCSMYVFTATAYNGFWIKLFGKGISC